MSLPYATSELRQGEARALFLNAVERLYPEVLISLRANVFPLYNGERLGWGYIRKDTDLRSALTTWGNKFHLDYPWVYDEALRTLNVAKQWGKWSNMNPIRWLGLDIGGGWEPNLDDLSLTPNPATETLEQFLNRAKEAYEQAVKRFEESGFSEDNKRALTDHLEWLAHLLVGSKSISKVAGENHRNRQTVTDGIKSACELLSIDYEALPKGEPGRPRKTSG
jgi:hypothetical protein